MLSAVLLVYVCTKPDGLDCSVYAPATWESESAAEDCRELSAQLRARADQSANPQNIRFVCEIDGTPEINPARARLSM